MSYQLLKINNVTKLCDDRILFDEDTNILDIQWFDFQLRKLCETLEIPIENKLQCPPLYHSGHTRPEHINYTNLFTRNQIFRELKKKYKSTFLDDGNHEMITIPDEAIMASKSDLENFGFCNKKNFLLFKKTLNADNQCEVIPESFITKGEVVIMPPFYTDDEKIASSLKSDVSHETLYNTGDFGDESVLAIKKKPSNPPNKKKSVAKSGVHVEQPKNKCEKYGKLKWYRNSCYMDSPIFLLFTRMLNHKDTRLSKHLLNYEITVDNINPKRCYSDNADETFTANSKEETVEKLGNILKEFRDVFANFKEGRTDNLNKFRELLGICGGVLTKKWSQGESEDSDEFLIDLFEIFQVKTPEINTLSNSSLTNTSTNYYFSDKNKELDKIIKFKNDHGSTNLAKYNFEHADGTKKYDIDINNHDESINHIQILNVTGINLQDIFRYGTTLHDLSLKPEQIVTIDKANWYNDKMLNLQFRTSDKQTVNNLIKTKELSITDMLYIADIIDYGEANMNSYYFFDSRYEHNDVSYYLKDSDEDSPPEIHPLNEVTEKGLGFKKSLVVEKKVLNTDTQDIFINISRIIGDHEGQTKLNFKVSNFETLPITGVTYDLHGLVYWTGSSTGKGGHYMSVFKCDSEYYHFDDLGGGSITKIGTYDDVISFRSGIILTNSTIFHYIRRE